MRQIIRKIILDLYGAFSNPKPGLHILSSHYAKFNNPTFDSYYSFLKKLSKISNFVKIEDAVKMILNHDFPKNDVLVAFTFDDGFEECHTIIAPVLEEFNTNGAFFVVPNFIDGDYVYRKEFYSKRVMWPHKKPMTWKQINDLKCRGHVIGSHTLDHMCVNSNNNQYLEEQLGASKNKLETKLKYSCEYFAFPFGQLKHINEKGLQIAEKYYKYIFTATNYKNYFSQNGRMMNRRQIEADWNFNHIKYFLSKKTFNK